MSHDPMTVGQLIELLNGYDPECEVVIVQPDGNLTHPRPSTPREDLGPDGTLEDVVRMVYDSNEASLTVLDREVKP